jgi:hypothetical protein
MHSFASFGWVHLLKKFKIVRLSFDISFHGSNMLLCNRFVIYRFCDVGREDFSPVIINIM